MRRGAAWQAVVVEVLLKEVGNWEASPRIEGRVHFAIVESVLIAEPTIADQPNISPELYVVFATDVGNIVGDVVYWRHAGNRMSLAVGLKNKAKVGIIAGAVSALSEGLPGKAISEVVYPAIADRPSVSSGTPPRMVPHHGRRCVV